MMIFLKEWYKSISIKIQYEQEDSRTLWKSQYYSRRKLTLFKKENLLSSSSSYEIHLLQVMSREYVAKTNLFTSSFVVDYSRRISIRKFLLLKHNMIIIEKTNLRLISIEEKLDKDKSRVSPECKNTSFKSSSNHISTYWQVKWDTLKIDPDSKSVDFTDERSIKS